MADEPLKIADRCDADNSAQAFVRVQKLVEKPLSVDVAELLFCAHHYNKYADTLFLEGWTVAEDTRDTINVKPSLSASNV